MAHFEISLAKPDFTFNASHFIAYRGYRERLHGHRYTVSLKFVGKDTLNSSGYLIEFGEIKKVVRAVCNDLDEYFLCPMKSDVLRINENHNQILIECEDGSAFSIPKSDCKLLPIAHTSAEELARYLWCRVVRDIGVDVLSRQNVNEIELTLSESEGQSATFRCVVPDALLALDSPKTMSIKGVPSFADLLLEDEQLQLTNGDDDLGIMPEPPDVVFSK